MRAAEVTHVVVDTTYVVRREPLGAYYVVNKATGRRVYATFRKQSAATRCIQLNQHALLRRPRQA